jgi:hypothetical protein
MKFGTSGTRDGTNKVIFFNTAIQEKPPIRRLRAFVFYKWQYSRHVTNKALHLIHRETTQCLCANVTE